MHATFATRTPRAHTTRPFARQHGRSTRLHVPQVTRHTHHVDSRSQPLPVGQCPCAARRILLIVPESSAASHKCRFHVRHFGRVFVLPYKIIGTVDQCASGGLVVYSTLKHDDAARHHTSARRWGACKQAAGAIMLTASVPADAAACGRKVFPLCRTYMPTLTLAARNAFQFHGLDQSCARPGGNRRLHRAVDTA